MFTDSELGLREMEQDYYQLGLAQTPAEFLASRKTWLDDPGSVRIQENPRYGHGWDVVVWLDGTYSDREEAEGSGPLLPAGDLWTVRTNPPRGNG
jgi:hypothetical protein